MLVKQFLRSVKDSGTGHEEAQATHGRRGASVASADVSAQIDKQAGGVLRSIFAADLGLHRI